VHVRFICFCPPDCCPNYSAIVWGASAKHSRGQKVGLEHVLEDEDGELNVAISDYLLTPNSRPHLQEVDIQNSTTALLEQVEYEYRCLLKLA